MRKRDRSPTVTFTRKGSNSQRQSVDYTLPFYWRSIVKNYHIGEYRLIKKRDYITLYFYSKII